MTICTSNAKGVPQIPGNVQIVVVAEIKIPV